MIKLLRSSLKIGVVLIFYVVVPMKIVCLIFLRLVRSQNDICPMANLPSLIITVVNDMEPKFFVLAN